MLAGVVIITLTVALMFFLMFFSWKISRVTKEIIFPEDKPQTESAKQVQSHISSFDRFPSSTLHTTKGKTPIFDLLTVSEDKKFEGPKHYDMHEKVLVNYAKTCPINRPVPIIIDLIPNIDILIKEAQDKAKKLIPRSTEPATILKPLTFEALEPEPKIKVELSFPDGTFKADTMSITKRLKPEKTTNYQFLVTPILGTDLRILLRIKYVQKAFEIVEDTEDTSAKMDITAISGTVPGDSSKRTVKAQSTEEEIELLVIDIPISAKALGNLNSQQLSIVTWVLGFGIVIAAATLAFVFPDYRPLTIILGAVSLIAKPILGSVDLTKLQMPKDATKSPTATAS